MIELEINKARTIAEVEADKFEEVMKALGKNTLV